MQTDEWFVICPFSMFFGLKGNISRNIFLWIVLKKKPRLNRSLHASNTVLPNITIALLKWLTVSTPACDALFPSSNLALPQPVKKKTRKLTQVDIEELILTTKTHCYLWVLFSYIVNVHDHENGSKKLSACGLFIFCMVYF
jgi:hypothetical protein